MWSPKNPQGKHPHMHLHKMCVATLFRWPEGLPGTLVSMVQIFSTLLPERLLEGEAWKHASCHGKMMVPRQNTWKIFTAAGFFYALRERESHVICDTSIAAMCIAM